MITRETIDKVFETARVEEVIGNFVQLKRAGSNYKGLSPFSDERSPSFMVSPVKQIWKDFSSGKGGSVVTFLMEHEHFTYPEAIRFLANKYNIEIEETEVSQEDKIEANEKESMYLVSEFAKTYFHETLLNSEEGKAIGLSYFKERGFTNETIAKFGLGYSPESWDAFTKEALGKGYQLEFLEKVGLTILREDGKHFDRFKGRVMFPIQSLSGRNLGFGGRILNNDKKAAKYLNSPESEIYHKSKVLYGIFHAKQAIAKQNNCYLVEGYTDVIQLHQAGIENVVASSGTALTPDQIRLINRLTKNITVLFDGDAAGLRASVRGIDLILEEGMNVKVCTFPDGDDPDSFAKKNSYEDLVFHLENNAKDFIQFKASLLMNEANNDPIKKADLIRDMVVSISKIPDRIKREIYIQETSRIMDISEQVLLNTLAQLVQKDISEAGKKLKQEYKGLEAVKDKAEVINIHPKVNRLFNLEKDVIRILLVNGNTVLNFEDYFLKKNDENELIEEKEIVNSSVSRRIYLSLQEDEIEFTTESFKNIYTEVISYYNQIEENTSFDNLLMYLSENSVNDVTSIIMEYDKESLSNWEGQNIFVALRESKPKINQDVTETILTLRAILVKSIIIDLMAQVLPEADNTEVMQTIQDYNTLLNSFAEKLGRVIIN
ncbi:MAG: DNA primase [Flavobacterium sp.]|uniref:DNA primase n=1 Tax=Flavobacterium sp. TaxID=239 RepID=UPI003266DE8D